MAEVQQETEQEFESVDLPFPTAPPTKRSGPETVASRHERERTDRDAFEYMRTLSDNGDIKVTVSRLKPQVCKKTGRNIKGHLETFDEPITEEDIQEQFGGGTYTLQIRVPNSQGKYVFKGSRTVHIAGDPRVIGPDPEQKPQREDADIVKQTLSTMQGLLDRNDRHGTDPAMKSLIEGLQGQLGHLQSQLASKDERILEMFSRKPEETTSDRLLGKMLEGESVRINGMRTQHESELRMLKENHIDEVKRLNERFDRMVERLEDNHKREIDSLKTHQEVQITALRTAQESVVDGYKREIKHLDRELTKSQTELAELRGKKDKSALDMLTEVSSLKTALDEFKGGGDESPSSTWERVAQTVMQSPILEGIGQRIAEGPGGSGGGAPSASSAEDGEMPINHPLRLPDGRVVVKKPDGKIMEIRKRKKTMTTDGGGGQSIEIDPEEVKVAVSFMEGAFNNETPPEVFASTARNLIPGGIMTALKAQGVDAFLSNVAVLEPGSPLGTQAGRNWIRKVADALMQ